MIVFAVDMPTVDLIMPVYNEQEGILAFHESLVAVPLPSKPPARIAGADDQSLRSGQKILNDDWR